jgi:hypothetical protein
MNKKHVLSTLIILGLLFCTLSAAGCSPAKIGDILADPTQFEGQAVSVKGTVGGTIWFSLLERGAYQVGDGTGNIWIITNQPPPKEGESVCVQGAVQSAINLGDRSFGIVISESKRSQ